MTKVGPVTSYKSLKQYTTVKPKRLIFTFTFNKKGVVSMQSTPTTNGAISSAFAFYMYSVHMLIRKLHMFMSIHT